MADSFRWPRTLGVTTSGWPPRGTSTWVYGSLLGEEAPVSANTVARLKEKWHAEFPRWRQRSLDDLEAIYLWVDGVYIKAALEKEKAGILVILAALADARNICRYGRAGSLTPCVPQHTPQD